MKLPNFSSYFSVQEEEIQEHILELLKSLNEPVSLGHLQTMFSCLDITNLNPAATTEEIEDLVRKTTALGVNDNFLLPAGLCFYADLVPHIRQTFDLKSISLVTVAGAFPHGRSSLETKLAEVKKAVEDGADEIDVVINRSLIHDHKFEEAFEEIKAYREATKGKTLKVILETGELQNLKYVLIAADIALYAGADFIKTSTGMVEKGASVEPVYVMASAIKKFYEEHNRKVGLKISGGVSNVGKAHQLYLLISRVLGDAWLDRNGFRIGSSSLAKIILNEMALETNNYDLRNYY